MFRQSGRLRSLCPPDVIINIIIWIDNTYLFETIIIIYTCFAWPFVWGRNKRKQTKQQHFDASRDVLCSIERKKNWRYEARHLDLNAVRSKDKLTILYHIENQWPFVRVSFVSLKNWKRRKHRALSCLSIPFKELDNFFFFSWLLNCWTIYNWNVHIFVCITPASPPPL